MRSALDHVLAKIDRLADRFGGCFPSGVGRGPRYEPSANVEWTPGFWPGMLWLAYRHTGRPRYRQAAERLLPTFRDRLERGAEGVETHDLGFLYVLSCVAAYRLTAAEDPRSLALQAARTLAGRFLESAGVVQAWGRLDDPGQRGRIIVDSAMNMPLLYWADAQTGDRTFGAIATRHLDQVARFLVRPDGSTAHTFFVDVESGEGGHARTHQGFADDSCWSRGQAWALYGFSVAHRYTAADRFLRVAKRVADHFLRRLPADRVCYWDSAFEEGDAQDKDTSAAAIAAGGLLELSGALPPGDADRERYRTAAHGVVAALSADHLSREAAEDGLLRHGVYDRPRGIGVGEFCLWGDYFYAEALMRLCTGAAGFW